MELCILRSGTRGDCDTGNIDSAKPEEDDVERVRSPLCASSPARCGREVPCPRASRAAMIAASPFGLRRSGIREQHVGSGLTGRSSEARPKLAPPGEASDRVPFDQSGFPQKFLPR